MGIIVAISIYLALIRSYNNAIDVVNLLVAWLTLLCSSTLAIKQFPAALIEETMILESQLDAALVADTLTKLLLGHTLVSRHTHTGTNLIYIVVGSFRTLCLVQCLCCIKQNLRIAEDRASGNECGRVLEAHIVNELLRVVTGSGTTMKILVVFATYRYIHGTLLVLTLVTPDTSLVEDGLLQTWVTVLVWILVVVRRILVDRKTIDGLVRINQILCRVYTTGRVHITRETTRSVEHLNFSCIPLTAAEDILRIQVRGTGEALIIVLVRVVIACSVQTIRIGGTLVGIDESEGCISSFLPPGNIICRIVQCRSTIEQCS